MGNLAVEYAMIVEGSEYDDMLSPMLFLLAMEGVNI
jgi:hypothetical protein